MTGIFESMHSLSAADVLRAWELGQSQHPVERALTLLGLSTGAPRERLAHLPIGQRDALLISLREMTLGPGLESTTVCPECSQPVEMVFNAGDIRIIDPADMNSSVFEDSAEGVSAQRGQLSGEFGSFYLRYRLPNSHDLAAILSARNPQEARKTLLRRCVLEVRGEDAPPDPADLPEAVFSWLGERIVQADPQGDILLDLSCPNCGHSWQAIFDIGAFFWKEIDSLSKRLLQEVHMLAGAYGWSEGHILNMTSARRQAYLEMVMG